VILQKIKKFLYSYKEDVEQINWFLVDKKTPIHHKIMAVCGCEPQERGKFIVFWIRYAFFIWVMVYFGTQIQENCTCMLPMVKYNVTASLQNFSGFPAIQNLSLTQP